MEIKYISRDASRYADTRNYCEVVGCEGKTDDEVKAFIGYRSEQEVRFGENWQEDYKRVSDGKATFTSVTPFLD